MRPNIRLSALCIVLLFFASQAQAASFRWITIGLGRSIGPADVSGDGSVVVGSTFFNGLNNAFRWAQSDGIVYIVEPLSASSSAMGVSSDGSVVVGETGAFLYPSLSGFRWTQAGGIVTDYSGPIRDVSGDGSVMVGTILSEDSQEAFRWTQAEGTVGLGDLPGGAFSSGAFGVSADGSVIVGSSYSEFDLEAFRWTQAGGIVGLGDLPGGEFQSRAYGVSADGSVIVGRGSSASGAEAFRWTQAEGMVGLGDLPGGRFFSVASDVSADGSVIVGTATSESGIEAFIWDRINGMRRLKDVLSNNYGINLTSHILTGAGAISDDGTIIVGAGKFYKGWRYMDAWIATIDPLTCNLPIGHVDYCSDSNCGPCDVGGGDCDGDGQCQAGLICAQDVGANYGMPANYDVCEYPPGSPCDVFQPGADWCRDCGPCAKGEGDCDGDNECQVGLVCVRDVGAYYGWPATRDVCEKPPGGPCDVFQPGPDWCRDCGPCAEGEGDCDNDAECAAGLICAWNVGANYGWPATRDVCEQPPGGPCEVFQPGPDWCRDCGPCLVGEGDCDGDAECAAGLVCAQDVGANYGWPASRDVCEQPSGPGDCILDSKFGLGSIKVTEYLYTDRTYNLTGGVPTWMVGRTLIQTPNDERNNNAASGYVRFINPVSWWVYVLFDSRSSQVPNWLSSWERRSAYKITTSLSSQPYLKVYRKMFDAGQCVDLGGNYGPGSSSETRSNYAVVYGQ